MPEAHRVPECPLEVVHQAPHEIAPQVDTLVDGFLGRPEVAVEVLDAARVVDGPVGADVVVLGGSRSR